MLRVPKSSDRVPLLHTGADDQYPATPPKPEVDATEPDPFVSAYAKLRYLMLTTALIHTISAIVITVLYVNIKIDEDLMKQVPRGDGRVERLASCWNVNATTDVNGTEDTDAFMSITNRVSTSTGMTRRDGIASLMILFFTFSAIFQFVSLVWKKSHMANTKTNAPQSLRYTEYMITASCMMVTIFMGIGLLERYLHLCVYVLTVICMAAGLLADYLRDISCRCEGSVAIYLRNAMMSSVVIGWVCMLTPWIVIFQAFNDLQNSTWADLCNTGSTTHTGIDSPTIPAEGGDMPWWVVFIIIAQFLLFNVFGFVQIYQVRRQFNFNPFNKQWLTRKEGYNEQNTGLVVEALFVFLSLTSKTLLGWLLFTQVLLQ